MYHVLILFITHHADGTPLALIGSGLSVLGNLAGNIIGANSTANANQQNWQHQLQMYGMQRADALSDYNMQNAYNAPAAQMARLKVAGLNPNLVYGSGADAGGGIVRPSSGSAPTNQPFTPNFSGASSAISDYLDLKAKDANIENTRANTQVLAQDQLLKAAQTFATGVSGQTAEFNLGVGKELRPVSIEQAKADLAKTLADKSYTISSNERAALTNAMDLKTAAQKILNMRMDYAKSQAEQDQIRAQIKKVQTSTSLDSMEMEMRKNGVTFGDPLWQRILGTIVNVPAVQSSIGNAGKLFDSPNAPVDSSTYKQSGGFFKK